MKAHEWIDRAKKAANIESDYAIAKALNVNRATVSNYRRSHGLLDEKVALRIAELLDMPPEKILLDQLAESVKTAKGKAALERYCILCKVDRATRPIAINPLHISAKTLTSRAHASI